jgi:hypothetical protein
VGHGDVLAVHFIAVVRRLFFRGEVGYELVAEEVEIDPFRVGTAFGAAEDGAVEMAGGFEVVYGDGDVERLDHSLLVF